MVMLKVALTAVAVAPPYCWASGSLKTLQA
jgi:hypothetical protein